MTDQLPPEFEELRVTPEEAAARLDTVMRDEVPMATTTLDWIRIRRRIAQLYEALLNHYAAYNWPDGPNGGPTLAQLNAWCCALDEVAVCHRLAEQIIRVRER
jgi:hypothetical protein